MGPYLVKPYLAQILLFWRNAFPRNLREMESEKQRGDAFTWQVLYRPPAPLLVPVRVSREAAPW